MCILTYMCSHNYYVYAARTLMPTSNYTTDDLNNICIVTGLLGSQFLQSNHILAIPHSYGPAWSVNLPCLYVYCYRHADVQFELLYIKFHLRFKSLEH